MYRIHPYEELIIQQKLNPAPRHRVHPVVTEPLRVRGSVLAAVRDALRISLPTISFGRREVIEPCPAC